MSFSFDNSANAALNKKQESLSKFINMLDDGFELLELIFDKQGNVVDFVFLVVNHAYERQTGLKAANLIGKRKKELAPASEQRWYDYAAKAAKTAKILSYEYYNDKVNGYFDTQFIPISTNQIAVLFKDITERKKAEETLKESEQKYHELYESFGEAFMATDWEFNVIHWNKAAERVTTVPSKDALGKKIYQVLPEMLTVDVTSYFEALKEKKPARFMMNVISRETKRQSWFEISTYPSDLGIIIIVEDKTEEEETKRLSVIGATAGMVGHDIRNPLQAIVNELFLARQVMAEAKEKDTKEVLESISLIQEQVDYINKIVSDLQDYARPLSPEYAIVDLSDLIVSVFGTTPLQDNIKVKVDIQGTIKIKTDPTFIKRSLSNLINNAIQAMPDGGELGLTAQKQEKSVVITVSDTGKGIPESVKDSLFTPLMTTKAKGQGLGLAVVKRLVEGLNGKVSFESEEGKGTKFMIELPYDMA